MLHEGAELGLFFNCKKSEVICDDNNTGAVVLSSLQGAKVVDSINVTLSGSSTGGVSSISISLEEKIKRLAVMGERLNHLPAQDSLLFLHHSLDFPNLMYNLMSSLCFLSPKLQEYDMLLKSIVSGIVNISLGEDGSAWIQGTLPV